jgi:hypothetical protein
LNFGRFVGETAEAFKRLSSIAELQKEDYEVRLLRFSAIYVMAIWLKASASADVIYPLSPTPAAIEAQRPYSEDKFFEAISPIAKGRSGAVDQIF